MGIQTMNLKMEKFAFLRHFEITSRVATPTVNFEIGEI